MKKKIYAIVKGPLDPVGYIREIDNTLKALQEIVGGKIESFTVGKGIIIICNENWIDLRLPCNCSINGVGFGGTILVVGSDRDDFGDVQIGLDQWESMLEKKKV